MRTLAALLVFLALPGTALAERTLGLDEALRLAIEANRDLAVAKERLAQARADVTAARARLLPSLSAQGRYLRNELEVALPLGPYTVTLQPLDQLTGSVTATVPLVVPPAWAGLSSASHGSDAAEASFDATRSELLLGVAQAFYAAAGADEAVAARREATTVTARTLVNARARLAAGAASPVDVTRAELAAVQATQAVAETEDVQARAYRALSTLLQLREPFRVAPGELKVAPAAAVDALTARALRTRPELRALRAAVAARGAALTAIDLRWAPTVAAFGTVSASDPAGMSGSGSTWLAGVQLDWSLFDGGTRIADRQRASSLLREARLQLERTQDALVDEVADRARGVETRRSAVAAAERGEALAAQTYEVIRTQYEAGTVAQIELLQAQDALVSARVGLARARFDVAVADLQLRRSVGEFPVGEGGET
jgi:outer membrane protein TolC